MKYKSNLRTFVDENLTESPSPCRRFPWLGPQLLVTQALLFPTNQHAIPLTFLSHQTCQRPFVSCHLSFVREYSDANSYENGGREMGL